jgi:YD repeat-containing protein
MPRSFARWTVYPLLTALLLLFALSPPLVAQQISYEYDSLGRLILMTSPEGVASWEYDSVGNLLRVTSRRYADAPDPVAILAVSPNQGAPGSTVRLYAKGLGATPADNQVAFNGVPASVVTVTNTSTLTVVVPTGATTGPISLTTPLGSATSPEPFTVLGAFALVPDQASVVLGSAYGFQATLNGNPTSAVTWRVSGIIAGTASLGTISSSGLYTAPATLPPVNPVSIEAVLTADPTRVASAPVTLLPPGAGRLATASVSLARREATAQASPLVSAAVSLQRSEAPSQANPLPSPTVALGREPMITALSPSSAPRGATEVPLTITGAGLAGASALTFSLNGTVDGTITVTALTAAPDGRSATATLSLSPTTSPGDRLVTITTATGTSPNLGLGSNRFTVTP